MATHEAVVTVGLKAPLATIRVPTVTPQDDEVRVRVEWTASTPLDLHQNDGGLIVCYFFAYISDLHQLKHSTEVGAETDELKVNHPQCLGDGVAGTVVEIGPGAKRLSVGDKVFGFSWRTPQEKAHQEYCTTNEYLLAKLPDGFTLQEAVTLPNNFVTVFHSLTTDLDIETPWPKPADYVPRGAEKAVLVWGAASSVGMYAVQILRWYGCECSCLFLYPSMSDL